MTNENNWKEEYESLANSIVQRDAYLISAMTVITKELRDGDYEPEKKADIVSCAKELLQTCLKLKNDVDRLDSKEEQWNKTMEMLSEWNEELEQENVKLKKEQSND